MITKTFFVGYNKKRGYDNLPIISMSVDPSDLFDYEKGKQPILDRKKDIRPEINHTLVDNEASKIVDFNSHFSCEYISSVSSPLKGIKWSKSFSISSLNSVADGNCSAVAIGMLNVRLSIIVNG